MAMIVLAYFFILCYTEKNEGAVCNGKADTVSIRREYDISGTEKA